MDCENEHKSYQDIIVLLYDLFNWLQLLLSYQNLMRSLAQHNKSEGKNGVQIQNATCLVRACGNDPIGLLPPGHTL